ncbi:SNIP1 [Lepeophtheirus salmonis]|uniref:SNIP1 n=1 Tax=Lepeophtheirus salmonis TaxID=72036 RepID=A0A7R8CZS4_LEPSM|nr:SNIP1 [Lepeophtheirus salmonis]CAF2977102.1 SNIP1 [Lepeophtheirus salmonis]
MSEDMIERVPPPPPPGFGDEEYYRLYGRPEEYHKYRQKLALSVRHHHHHERKVLEPPGHSHKRPHHHPHNTPSSSMSQHRRPSPGSAYSIQARVEEERGPNVSSRSVKGPPFNSYEEEYEHFYGKKNKETKLLLSDKEDDEEGTPELSSSEEEDEISVEELSGSDDGSEGEVFDSEEEEEGRKKGPVPKKKYENFRVTIHNESDEGTPSLSEDEGDRDRRRSPMRSNKRGKSIKDRLGVRARPPSPPSPPPLLSPPSRRRRHSSSPLGNHSSSSKRKTSHDKQRLSRRKVIEGKSEPDKINSSSRKGTVSVVRNGDMNRQSSPSRNHRRRKDTSRENGGYHRNGKYSSLLSSSNKKPRPGLESRRRDYRKRRSPLLRGMESETHRRADRLLTRSPEEKSRIETQAKNGSTISLETYLEVQLMSKTRERSKERDRKDKHRSRSRSHRRRRRRRKSKRHSSRSSSRSSSSSSGSRRRRSRSSSSYSRSYSRSTSRSSRSISSFSSSSSRSSSSKSSLDSYLRLRRRRRHHRQSSSPCRPMDKISNIDLVDEKEQPNLNITGKLAQDSNTVNGVVVKYTEPPDCRRPRTKWRLYVLKEMKNYLFLYIHRQSSYLLGRDRKVADVPLDHPSCSKQHAALQYRLVQYNKPDGSIGKRVRPYIIDLNSANGTFINNKKMEPHKYIQVLEKDVLKFGFSSREYVLLHDQSNDAEMKTLALVPDSGLRTVYLGVLDDDKRDAEVLRAMTDNSRININKNEFDSSTVCDPTEIQHFHGFRRFMCSVLMEIDS